MPDGLTLQNQITLLFLEEMNLEVPSSDTDLFEAGILDSLAFVNLALHLEQKFGVKITIESMELDNFRSIARIARFLDNHNNHNGDHNNKHSNKTE